MPWWQCSHSRCADIFPLWKLKVFDLCGVVFPSPFMSWVISMSCLALNLECTTLQNYTSKLWTLNKLFRLDLLCLAFIFIRFAAGLRQQAPNIRCIAYQRLWLAIRRTYLNYSVPDIRMGSLWRFLSPFATLIAVLCTPGSLNYQIANA